MKYDAIRIEEHEIVFYITEACNSNCIMCPMSADSRKRGIAGLDKKEWECFVDDVYSGRIDLQEIENVCITGGEPLLKWKLVVDILSFLTVHLPNVPVLLLTNGRAFSLRLIQSAFSKVLTSNCRVAVPIHSLNSVLHDQITQTVGSFKESSIGLQFLTNTPSEIEIRVVGHQINASDLQKTLSMLPRMGWRITCVNIIAMEMHGCAARWRKQLWINYDNLFSLAKAGVMSLIEQGIDVGLYNFPLCMLPRSAWGIAKDSISRYKIRYNENCSECMVKDSCGGLFQSTYLLKLCHTKPVLEINK